MVQREFMLSESGGDWKIEDQSLGKVLDLPEKVKDDLKGKYLSEIEMLKKISRITIALAGVTDSLNVVDENSLKSRSVLKAIKLNKSGTIDDTIDEIVSTDEDSPESIVKQYEKYHTLKMDRDVPGNDDTIHAYIQTPNDGKLRSTFSKKDGIRLDSRRNNITYWLEDYRIESGSAGGKFIRPIGTPIEMATH